MRILLSAYGSRGDVEPMVALGERLAALGVQVRICTPPDPEFADLVAGAGAGLTQVPFGPPVRPLLDGTAPPSAADAPRRAQELIGAQFGPVAAAARGCDVVVATGLMPAGMASAAQDVGARYVFVCYQPILLPSEHHPPLPRMGRPYPPEVTDNTRLWELDAQAYAEFFGPKLNPFRETLGLPAVHDVRGHILTDRPWLAADPVLSPWHKTDLDVVQTGAWVRTHTRLLPADLAAFLDRGTPPVFVGFGSMPAPRDSARVAIEAIRAQGRRAVVSRGWAGLGLIDDRDDCFPVGEVDYQTLFGRVAAVVHHGGAGTTTAAARAGAPQVIIPQWVDQPYWAGRVAALGIGAAHDGPVPSTESLSAALRTALAPQTRARAAAVAGTVRTDGTAVAADLLLASAARKKSAGRG